MVNYMLTQWDLNHNLTPHPILMEELSVIWAKAHQ